ncbi:MAG: TIGR00645 family protein [Kiritimatiellia bacterium]
MNKPIKLGNVFASVIVASQWLQAPLYFGLIVAQGVYVWQFCVELYHLVCGLGGFKAQEIMLMVLGLIDVVMISNLLIMVIIGGYHTFVAKIHFSEQNPPDWLDHVNASTMKVKLSMALIGISSIHLLKSFIEIEKLDKVDVYVQMGIHFLFIISAIGLAYVAKMTETAVAESRPGRKPTEHPAQG